MAETTQQKRLRDESHIDSQTLECFEDSNSNPSKRQKPYNNILTLLEQEEDHEEPNQDLSDIFTTLQQELSSSTTFDIDPPPAQDSSHMQTTTSGDDDDDVKSVMQHLLEASDDELGIPSSTEDHYGAVEVSSDDGENFPFAFVDNGLWELEDVAANYYTMLQSELFM